MPAGGGCSTSRSPHPPLPPPACTPTGARERVRDGERGLLEYVEAEARELSGEGFSRLMGELYARIQGMLARQ